MVPSPEELRNGIANKVDKSSRQTALDVMRRIPIEALVPAGVSITKFRDLSIVNLAQVANVGMADVDAQILSIMLAKKAVR